jgi:hypothetical protein
MATGGPLPTRFCPACYRRNPWEAERCTSCDALLEVDDDLDTRLIWALDHPDTDVAVRAAAAIAARRVTGAIGALGRLLDSAEAYRAAAAVDALVAFEGQAAREAVEKARGHPSIIVRRAVEHALADRLPAQHSTPDGS